MQAWLRAQGVWRIVAAVSLAPKLPASPAVTSEAQITALDAWELKSDKACGWMYLSIKDDQKIHLKGIEGDPVKIWAALSAIHLQKCPGMRFNAAATIPFDINLWHHRLGHHSYADVQKMIKDGLVIGLHLDSKEQPDPICEPCLAGKMTANPFPTSTNQSYAPLELIHTDLHGPLPVTTAEGYCYWMTFIDACTKL